MGKCSAWREGDQGFVPFSYDRCYATKEIEVCECLGNEAFCDFYPEKRKAATTPKFGQWISVKDRLPEAVEDVLVCCKRGVGIGCYFNSTKLWANDSFHSWEITHWMPLPEPPKED